MEGKRIKMMPELNEIEYDILNCLYFVESFEKILEKVAQPPAVVADVLKTLIHKKIPQLNPIFIIFLIKLYFYEFIKKH